MAISEYLRELRDRVGTRLLLVPSVAALIYDSEGRLLMARHTSVDAWAPPGGAVDPDEGAADAIVREVYEETGLHIRPLRAIGVFSGPQSRVRYSNGDLVSYVVSAFECRRLGGTLRTDGDEISELRFLDEADCAALKLAPWAREGLHHFLERRGQPWIPEVRWRPPEEAI